MTTAAASTVGERLRELFPHKTHLQRLTDAQEVFTKDISEHVLNVVREDGVYRHLLARRPGTSFYWFEVITWPNSLTIHGDMGTYTFSRTEDMFTFFRGERINPSYWSEKLQSDGRGKRFSADLAAQYVTESISEWAEEHDDEDALAMILSLMKGEVVPALADESEDEVRSALVNFSSGDFDLHHSWEWDLKDFTPHFLWCCHAIVWAIKQYDAQSVAS